MRVKREEAGGGVVKKRGSNRGRAQEVKDT